MAVKSPSNYYTSCLKVVKILDNQKPLEPIGTSKGN